MTRRHIWICKRHNACGATLFAVLFLFLLSSSAHGAAIVREAESAQITAPMVIRTDVAASGGRYVELPPGTANNLDDSTNGGPGEARFTINIPEAGTYTVWARARAADTRGRAGSFYVSANGKRLREWSLRRGRSWKWYRVTRVRLNAGSAQLAFRQRTPGIKLDSIVLTDKRRFTDPTSGSFTIVVLPDTQFYSRDFSRIFADQTNWIVANRDTLNIVYVAHVGDVVDSGNSVSQWNHAEAALELLENRVTTRRRDGIPYGLSVGNHDQSPNANPDGNSTQLYNSFFGVSRFSGRSYYGGHFGSNNDNHYSLFTAGGVRFIVIHLEYDSDADPAVLAWADNLLKTHSDRHGIIVSHYLVDLGNPAPFGRQGQAIYDALKGNANLSLMLAGHRHGEGRRTDVHNGNTVHTLLADYQGRTNGGDGWLRILRFFPVTNQIRVSTFSPTLNRFETDADSEFTLSFDMQSSANRAPVVRIEPDQMIKLPASAALAGNVTDNGPVSLQWRKVSGPGTVTFDDPTTLKTTARFSEAGPYVLELVADNGEKQASAETTVMVSPAAVQPTVLEFEAENGRLSETMEVRRAPGASNGLYAIGLESSAENHENDTGNPGELAFSVNIPQGGHYALWARTIAPDFGGKTFYVTAAERLVSRWTAPASSGWKWHKVADLFLGAGTFDLAFKQGPNGAGLDKLVLTNDLQMTPQ